jgi:hypothetical protein
MLEPIDTRAVKDTIAVLTLYLDGEGDWSEQIFRILSERNRDELCEVLMNLLAIISAIVSENQEDLEQLLTEIALELAQQEAA